MIPHPYHVAVPTAFGSNHSLDIKHTIDNIHRLYSVGIRAFLVCGSTGEQHNLSLAEKMQLVDSLHDVATLGDVELMFGVSSINASESYTLASYVDASKAIQAILLGYPPYVCPTQQEAYRYTATICEMVGVGVVLYNNPLRTGFDLLPHTIAQLAACYPLAGIKEAGAVARIGQLRQQLPNPFTIFAGGDRYLHAKVAAGANALSSVLGNLYPKEIGQYLNWLLSQGAAVVEPDSEMETLIESHYQLAVETSLLPALKNTICQQHGIPMGGCRSILGVTMQ